MKTFAKTILTTLAVGLIACGFFSQQVEATPISGAIAFSGVITLDTGDVNTATAVTGWGFAGPPLVGSPFVSGADGDFTSLLGMSATFVAPWFFNMPAGPTIPSFWSVGGFTFDLLTSAAYSQGGGFLGVSGTGVIHGAGFTDTFGTWAFTTQNPSGNGVFSFSSSGPAVPDSGSTVALLGLTLVGVEFLRQTLRKARE